MLTEATRNYLDEQVNLGGLTVVLVYTTMCGTCESAKVMLNVVSEAIPGIEFMKINANLNQSIITKFDITSVPCFLCFKNGIVVDQFYAFHSVTYLFEKINQLKQA